MRIGKKIGTWFGIALFLALVNSLLGWKSFEWDFLTMMKTLLPAVLISTLCIYFLFKTK
ncbi:hypothetical protein [Paenibacillus puerhi]|uniref:hypothetical protein n=1 Tax=Paenibacillus puerhi TaxID=2692622 RepID=UPI00135A66D5|nr:hypothetical protein [Paenibacillus puerhi]